MLKHEYWKHMSSGEVYAVMVKDERAYLAAGPLSHEEVTAENLREWNFAYEADLEIWLNQNNDDFGLHEIEGEKRIYKYPLTTSQEARARLDEKAASDGYGDADVDYPHLLLSVEVTAQANNHVNVALDMDDNTTDDEEEYRARYVDAYCKAYAAQIQSRRADEEATK